VQIAAWSQFVCGPGTDLRSNLRWLAAENLGVIFNWKPDLLGPAGWTQTPTGYGWMAVVLLSLAGVAAAQAVRGRRELGAHAQLGFYLIVVGAQAALAYSIVGCTVQDGTLIRYTLLTLYVPIGLLILFFCAKPPRWLRTGVLGLVVVWGACSFADTTRFLAAYVAQPPPSTARELADHLEAEGVRYGRGIYWIAYQLDFLTQERLTISSLDKVRVEEYQRIADENDQLTVHVLPNQGICEEGVVFQEWCLQYFERARGVAPGAR
jgi:hypothetical protein